MKSGKSLLGICFLSIFILFVMNSNYAMCETFYKPNIIKTINITGNAYDIDFSNYSDNGINYDIFIASGHGGLLKVDQNLDDIEQISSEWIWRGEISNKNQDKGWMYYASGLGGYRIFYIGNDNSSYFVDIQDTAREIKEITSDKILVLSEKGGVYLYSNDSRPTLISSIDLSGELSKNSNEKLFYVAIIDEQNAYVASNQNSLFLIKLSDDGLTSDKINTISEKVKDIEKITVHQTNLYIMEFNNGLIKYGISEKSAPEFEQELVFGNNELGQYISIIGGKLFCSTDKALYQSNYNYDTGTFDIENFMRFNEPEFAAAQLSYNSASHKYYLNTYSSISIVELQQVTTTQLVGSIQVSLSPEEAITEGAQWRIDEGEWNNSEITISNLSVGSHTVEFKEINGWTTPPSQTVDIESGQTSLVSAIYNTLSPSKPIVTTGIADSITLDSAALNGVINPNGNAITYYFEYGLTTSYGFETPSIDDTEGDSSDKTVTADVTGLAPNTTYQFRLVVCNNEGEKIYGDNQFFTTTALTLPENVNAYNVLKEQSNQCSINYGEYVRVFGASGGSIINVQSGGRVECVNFVGSNVVNIDDQSGDFTVRRSGAMVYLSNATTGTLVKIPATKTSQAINFADCSYSLVITNGKVMLNNKEITLIKVQL
ncbi:MAG: fibronectin type III domain-containing protein [Desulfamplus sp.]|nr:fibronectin type III domain-containing protein [Desulfamplus sp.]